MADGPAPPHVTPGPDATMAPRPAAASTTRMALGPFPLADVTVKIIPIGTSRTDITFDDWDWVLKTTQTVQLHLVSLKPVAFPVNIVGNNCTSAPFAQVLNGRFHTTGTGPGTSYDYWMSGTYTIPNFSNCGLNTLAVNLAIPGPGNTAKVHFTR